MGIGSFFQRNFRPLHGIDNIISHQTNAMTQFAYRVPKRFEVLKTALKKQTASLKTTYGNSYQPKRRDYADIPSTQNADITWLQVFNPKALSPSYTGSRDNTNHLFYGLPDPDAKKKDHWWWLRALLKFPKHVGKFFLEYLPYRLEKWAGNKIDELKIFMYLNKAERQKAQFRQYLIDNSMSSSPPMKAPSRAWNIAYGIGIFLLSIVYYPSKLVRYLGRAAFSPWNHAKAGFEAGYKTASVQVVDERTISGEIELSRDAEGYYLFSTDGNKTFRRIMIVGNALQIDENGRFRAIGDPVAPVDSVILPADASLERRTTKNLWVDRYGNYLDQNGMVIQSYIEGDETVRARDGVYRLAKDQEGWCLQSQPESTGWSWLFGGFNLLTSLALIIVSLKYVASSAIGWLAQQIDSSLTAIQLAEIPAEASLAIEISAGITAVAEMPSVLRETYDAYRDKENFVDSKIAAIAPPAAPAAAPANNPSNNDPEDDNQDLERQHRTAAVAQPSRAANGSLHARLLPDDAEVSDEVKRDNVRLPANGIGTSPRAAMPATTLREDRTFMRLPGEDADEAAVERARASQNGGRGHAAAAGSAAAGTGQAGASAAPRDLFADVQKSPELFL